MKSPVIYPSPPHAQAAIHLPIIPTHPCPAAIHLSIIPTRAQPFTHHPPTRSSLAVQLSPEVEALGAFGRGDQPAGSVSQTGARVRMTADAPEFIPAGVGAPPTACYGMHGSPLRSLRVSRWTSVRLRLVRVCRSVVCPRGPSDSLSLSLVHAAHIHWLRPLDGYSSSPR